MIRNPQESERALAAKAATGGVVRETGAMVVTGASGLLGSNFLLFAREREYCVTAVSYKHGVHMAGVDCQRVDLASPEAALLAMEAIQPGSIVHCAAATDVDWCEEHPEEATRINVEAPALLAGFAHELDIPFIQISTDAVFDGTGSYYSETDEPNPVNHYARTKLQGEREVLRRNPNAIIGRVTLYGWSAQRKPSLAEWVFDSLAAGQTVPGFQDVYFSPILVNDLCELILDLLQRRERGIFHLVGSQRISKYEFARSVARIFSFEQDRVLPVKVGESGLRARRPLDISLNTEKITKVLGRAMPDVESGLRKFRDLYENGYRQKLQTLLSGEIA